VFDDESNYNEMSFPEDIKKLNPMHSAKSAEHYSPNWVVELGSKIMDGIDTDPATSEIANLRVRATTIYTADRPLAAFNSPWPGKVFINPPGGNRGRNVKIFWERLVAQYRAGICTTAFYVGFSLEQLGSLQNTQAPYCPLDFPIIYPRRRISYMSPEGQEEGQPTHGSFLCLLPNLKEAGEQSYRLFKYGREYGKVVWPSWTK
jgi:hypothetical protein